MQMKFNHPDEQRVYEQGIVDGTTAAKVQVNQDLVMALGTLNEVPGLGEKTIEKINRQLNIKMKVFKKKHYNRPRYQRIYDLGIVKGIKTSKPQEIQELVEQLASLYEVDGLGQKTVEKVLYHLHSKIVKSRNAANCS